MSAPSPTRCARALKDVGVDKPRVEGLPHCDWVLIDAGDVIVHVFRPEVRGVLQHREDVVRRLHRRAELRPALIAGVRVVVAAIGRMKQGPERELVARYLERARAAGKPLGLAGFEVAESAESRASSAARRKTEEAESLAAAAPEGFVRIALDEHGKPTTSEAFAADIAQWRDAGRPGLCFLHRRGGRARSRGSSPPPTGSLALSPLTWPHQLVRILRRRAALPGDDDPLPAIPIIAADEGNHGFRPSRRNCWSDKVAS